MHIGLQILWKTAHYQRAEQIFAWWFKMVTRQFFAQHCSDAFRCYLELAEYGSNGRQGVLVISEGMEGIGWQSLFFADEV